MTEAQTNFLLLLSFIGGITIGIVCCIDFIKKGLNKMGHEERIALNDSLSDVARKLSEGNPGAISVILQLIDNTEKIDPDSIMGPLTYLLSLDSFGIYGPRIWMLYKDACGQDIVAVMAVLRAVQLGLLEARKMNHAIDNYGDGIEIVEIFDLVKKQLPNFSGVS